MQMVLKTKECAGHGVGSLTSNLLLSYYMTLSWFHKCEEQSESGTLCILTMHVNEVNGT